MLQYHHIKVEVGVEIRWAKGDGLALRELKVICQAEQSGSLSLAREGSSSGPGNEKTGIEIAKLMLKVNEVKRKNK